MIITIKDVRLPLFLPLVAVASLMYAALFGTVAQEVRFIDTTDGKQIELVSVDGQVIRLNPGDDEDGDGVSNELEVIGFTYSPLDGLQLWDGDSSVVFFKTDPGQWSTDGDPYSDYMEVTGVNMPSGVLSPQNHPLVAARPVISVAMDEYDVIPISEITNTQGGHQSTAYTNECSYTEEVGSEITSDLSFSLTDLGGGIEASSSYSQSWTTTESTTSEFGSEWSNTRSTNPSAAARLKLNLHMQNLGSATALDVSPTFNLVLGEKTIATITPNQVANRLEPAGLPNDRYPEFGTIAVEFDNQGEHIIVTMEELKAIQMGAPLGLVVTQVDANVVRWDEESQSFDGEIGWASFESQIDPRSVTIKANLGDDDTRNYQVFIGTPWFTLDFKFRDVLSHVFEMVEIGDFTYIEERQYPGDWYIASPSEEVLDEWNNQGQPLNLLPLKMFPNTQMVMYSAGNAPEPRVNLATFKADFKGVYVSAFPGNFPIVSVRAQVTVGGELQEVELTRDESALYSNETPFSDFAETTGVVLVENAAGDVAEVAIILPALYATARDVKEFAGLIPIPGGDFILFSQGDPEKAVRLYCLFYDPDTEIELETPREYLTLDAVSDTSNYIELISGWNDNNVKRVYFSKLNINPATFKVDRFDTTFTESQIPDGGWDNFGLPDPRFGNIHNYSAERDSNYANIDLRGTPFSIDPSNDYFYEDAYHAPIVVTINADRDRQLCDFLVWNGDDQDHGEYGFAGDSLQLIFTRDYVDAVAAVDLEDNTLQFNLSSSGEEGYANMGDAPSLEVSDALTIEAWVKPEAHGRGYHEYQILFNREGEYEVARFPDGTIRWAATVQNYTWEFRNTHFVAEYGEWFHIAMAYDKNSDEAMLKIYINGDQMFQATPAGGDIGDVLPSHNDFRVGGRQTDASANFSGMMDELRVWNIARTQEDIRTALVDTLGPEIYSSAESGLIGYWRFNALQDLGVGEPGANDVRDYSLNGNHGDVIGDVQLSGGITAIVGGSENRSPGEFILAQNYPNPFNPETAIEFDLKRASDVRLDVFNTLGQRVATLVNGNRRIGQHRIVWDGTNDFGQKVASGFYLYRMTAGGLIQTRKMILMK